MTEPQIVIKNETPTVIWKYPIPIEGDFKIEIPIGPELCHVGLDPSGDPCVWMAINPNNEKIQYHFGIFGTGQPFPQKGRRVGTFVYGTHVWHLFDIWGDD